MIGEIFYWHCLLSLVDDVDWVDHEIEIWVVDDDVDILNSHSEQTIIKRGYCTSSISGCNNISGDFNTATQKIDTV